MVTLPDTDIISALQEDAERGFRLLMAKYKQAAYWHIRRLVVSHDDAQDAAQETFIRVFRSFGQFRGSQGQTKDGRSLAAWIYRIATNEALCILQRRHNGQLSLEDFPTEANLLKADNYVDYNDLEAVKLQKAIIALPTKQQLAFNLRYYDELGYDEIASITGSTPANVKSNYHMAKEKIVKYMKTND